MTAADALVAELRELGLGAEPAGTGYGSPSRAYR